MAKRRANGEGNIRKRKDGRWEGRYTAGYDPESGKRIIKNVLGKTQAEVKEKLKRALEDNERIDAAKSRDLTVGQWVVLWFENYAKPSIRESTAEHYRNFVENHIAPDIGKIKLRKLTTLDIQKFYTGLGKTAASYVMRAWRFQDSVTRQSAASTQCSGNA